MSTIDLPSFKRFVGAALILSAQMGKWGSLVKDDRGRAVERSTMRSRAQS